MVSPLLNNLTVSFKQFLKDRLSSLKSVSKSQEQIADEQLDLKGRSFLIVDDDALSKFVFANYLKRWNGNVDIADSGFSALEMLNVSKYDIILMDIEMPGMNGIETTAKIREQEHVYFKTVPIIAVTALNPDKIKSHLLTVGFDDCVTKEVVSEDFYKKLVYFLNRGKN